MKKAMRIFPLILLAMMLLASFAHARSVPELLSGGLVEINNFFTGENYRSYAKAIDFFFFALLFIAIYLMGAKYAFKEVKNPEKAIVVLLGLMTAFLLVLGDFSATMLIPWIHWLFYLLLFFFYWWLYKGIENKFWRFLLALLSTILTIMLMQGLLNWINPEVPDVDLPGVPSVKGGFFKDFFGSFKGISLPGVSMPGFPDYAKDWFGKTRETIQTTTGGTDTPIIQVTPDGTTSGGIVGGVTPDGAQPAPATPSTGLPGYDFEWKDLWPLIFLPLIFLFLLIKRKKKKELPIKKAEEDADLDQLIKELEEAINKKRSSIEKIRSIIKRKLELEENGELLDLYHKKIDADEDAFYLDPGHKKHEDIMDIHKEVTDLLKNELNLEKELIELMELEDELLGTAQVLPTPKPKKRFFFFTQKEEEKDLSSYQARNELYGKLHMWKLKLYKIAPPKNEFQEFILNKAGTSFDALGNANAGIVSRVRKQIKKYYVWTLEEAAIERFIAEMTDHRMLKRWFDRRLMPKWHAIRKKKGEELKQVFVRERWQIFQGTPAEPGLFNNLIQQYKHLIRIRRLLEMLKNARASMTKMQDLFISRLVGETFEDVTASAMGLQLGNVYKIHTRIQRGIHPFRVQCLVGSAGNFEKRGSVKQVALVHDKVEFTFEEIGIDKPGEFDIRFVCISTQKVYLAMDVKEIKIFVQAAPQKMLGPGVGPLPLKMLEPGAAPSKMLGPGVDEIVADELKIAPKEAATTGVTHGTRIGILGRLVNGAPVTCYLFIRRIVGKNDDGTDKVITVFPFQKLNLDAGSSLGIEDELKELQDQIQSGQYVAIAEAVSQQVTQNKKRVLFTSDKFGNLEPGEYIAEVDFVSGDKFITKPIKIKINGKIKAERYPEQLSFSNIIELKPLNSFPDKPITLVGDYLRNKSNELDIGNEETNDIVLADTPRDEQTETGTIPQAKIRFVDRRGFVIFTTRKSEVYLDGKVIETYGYLSSAKTLKIYDYEFEVSHLFEGQPPLSEQEFNAQFIGLKLYLLKAQQMAEPENTLYAEWMHENEELLREYHEFDKWYGEEEKEAVKAIRTGRKDKFVFRYERVLNRLKKEKTTLRTRSSKWLKKNIQQIGGKQELTERVNSLFKQVDVSLKKGDQNILTIKSIIKLNKTSNRVLPRPDFSWNHLKTAKLLLNEILVLTFGSVSEKRYKNNNEYNRAKFKRGDDDGGIEPFDAIRAENPMGPGSSGTSATTRHSEERAFRESVASARWAGLSSLGESKEQTGNPANNSSDDSMSGLAPEDRKAFEAFDKAMEGFGELTDKPKKKK